MESTKFKVKTQSTKEYVDRLKEFTVILDTWKNNKSGRDYVIEEDVEGLEFSIKASKIN